jgi:hypothetical protein
MSKKQSKLTIVTFKTTKNQIERKYKKNLVEETGKK